MIQVQNLSLAFGDRTLFQNVNLRLLKGHRYGLVGANGSGKTSFCKILLNDLTPSTGSIQIPKDHRIGVMLQNQYAYEEQKIIDVVMQGKEKMWAAIAEKESILSKTGQLSERDGQTLAELETVLADHDAYQAEAKAGILLQGLGISSSIGSEKMQILSGGYKIRVLLARMLFSEPEILLLDEPNNHLDLESILWLENYLLTFPGLVLLISHDHNLINRVSDHILDVDYQEVRLYKGNYEQFLEQKAESETMKEKNIASQERKRDDLQKFITRFSAKASKARQANSKKKMIEKMDIGEIVRSSRVTPGFKFEQKRLSGREVLRIEGLNKSYGEKPVLKDLSLKIERGQKLAILGYNGAGKSTLLKILSNNLEPDGGSFEWGFETHVGYFAQNQRDLIDSEDSPYEWLYRHAPQETISGIRGALGRMLFSGDDVMKKAGSLSGGELSRLIFTLLIYRKNNVLLLDEPTNHLDLDSIESLMDALENYEGTLIFVSHDEYFTERLANAVLYFSEDGHQLHDCGYAEFKRKYLKTRTEKPASGKNKSVDVQTKNVNEAKIKKLQKESAKLEKLIEDLEGKNSVLSEEISLKSQENPGGFEEIDELYRKQQKIQKDLEKRMEKWEGILREIDELQN